MNSLRDRITRLENTLGYHSVSEKVIWFTCKILIKNILMPIYNRFYDYDFYEYLLSCIIKVLWFIKELSDIYNIVQTNKLQALSSS